MTISDLTHKYFCCVGHRPGDFAESERAADETIAIPIYPELTAAQQDEVVEVVRGPLHDVKGILLRKEKRRRLVLGVRPIQQAAAIEIDVNDVVSA